jgi:hypothetical protein
MGRPQMLSGLANIGAISTKMFAIEARLKITREIAGGLDSTQIIRNISGGLSTRVIARIRGRPQIFRNQLWVGAIDKIRAVAGRISKMRR